MMEIPAKFRFVRVSSNSPFLISVWSNFTKVKAFLFNRNQMECQNSKHQLISIQIKALEILFSSAQTLRTKTSSHLLIGHLLKNESINSQPLAYA